MSRDNGLRFAVHVFSRVRNRNLAEQSHDMAELRLSSRIGLGGKFGTCRARRECDPPGRFALKRLKQSSSASQGLLDML